MKGVRHHTAYNTHQVAFVLDPAHHADYTSYGRAFVGSHFEDYQTATAASRPFQWGSHYRAHSHPGLSFVAQAAAQV